MNLTVTAVDDPTPVFAVSPSSKDYGTQTVATSSSSQTFTVTNTGTANLTITTAALAGSNPGEFTKTTDTCTGATVAPNATCTVTVTFAPTTAGAKTATLQFTHNDAASPHTVALTGTGTAVAVEPTGPDMVLSKRVVSGAQAVVGDRVRYRLQVSNKGTAPTSSRMKLIDKLPAGLELVSAHGKGWRCTVRKATDNVSCVRNQALRADQKAPPVFVVAVATNAAMGRVVNVASVRVAGETATSNNRDKAPITVVPAQLPATGLRAVPPGI